MIDKLSDFKAYFDSHQFILMEAAIVERLRRDDHIHLDPILVSAPLIYDPVGSLALQKIYDEYLDVAENKNLPIFICTPTWRCDYDRIQRSKKHPEINKDASAFLHSIRRRRESQADKIKIGGLIGCKNDCYRPEESLNREEAKRYHSWQIGQLIEGGVDFIIAETLPAIEEAIGIAQAAAEWQIPYFISFVIGRDGLILDGTKIIEAIQLIDQLTENPPLGYMVNCAYPTFLQAEKQPAALFNRLDGYLANASSLDHCDLDGAEGLFLDDINDWAKHMNALYYTYGVKVLGGCCGTNASHLKAILPPE